MPLESAIHCIDQIATMTKQRIVSGPFDNPLLPDFRANPLFVVKHNNKYWLILDLFSPEGLSYNNALDICTVPNIMMVSLRAIAGLLYQYSSEAYLSRLDHKSTFKLVAVQADIVKFLGKFFVETQLVLRGQSSPDKYNLLYKVFLLVASLHSQVDD